MIQLPEPFHENGLHHMKMLTLKQDSPYEMYYITNQTLTQNLNLIHLAQQW
jgi:hypothetical protein